MILNQEIAMILHRHTNISLALLLLLVTIYPSKLSAKTMLPDIAPPYKAIEGAMQKPQLKVGSFVKNQVTYEQPAFWIGNKRIGMREFDGKYLVDRDQMLGLFIDERLVMNITFWGSIKGQAGVGYPFANLKDDPDELIADTKTQTITYRKPYRLPDGKRAVFTHTLRPGDGSKLIFEWDMGITEEQLNTYGNAITLAPWFIFNKNYRDQPIDINGKTVVFASKDALTTQPTDVLHGEDMAFTYAPDSPLQQFSFSTSKYLRFDIKEKTH